MRLFQEPSTAVSNMLGRIHSFESFGTVDGPGVRFVVFMQGCVLRCLYCHNPDTWCLLGGTEYTASSVLEKMTRNITFYKTGGITVTGGEPLLQIEFVTELFTLAKAQGIHTCIDTSGINFDAQNAERMAKFDALIKVTDLFMLDIKSIDAHLHMKLTGAHNRSVLAFARYLKDNGKKMRIRYVLVPNLTDKKEQLTALGKFLIDFDNIEKIEVLPYHTLGASKYENLGIDYPLKDTPQATKEQADTALKIILDNMKRDS